MTPRVLVTAFKPFDGRSVNAASTIAAALHAGTIAGYHIDTVELKVSWSGVEDFARQSLPDESASYILALGEANRDYISIETLATPQCRGDDIDGIPPPATIIPVPDCVAPHNNISDNNISEENQPLNRTLADGGLQPACLTALDALCSSQPASDHEAAVRRSQDAGQYLCNRLLYLGLHYAPCPFLFVHLPLQDTLSREAYLSRHLPVVKRILHQFVQPAARQ